MAGAGGIATSRQLLDAAMEFQAAKDWDKAWGPKGIGWDLHCAVMCSAPKHLENNWGLGWSSLQVGIRSDTRHHQICNPLNYKKTRVSAKKCLSRDCCREMLPHFWPDLLREQEQPITPFLSMEATFQCQIWSHSSWQLQFQTSIHQWVERAPLRTIS